jgi:hypothetical protein
MFQKIRSVAGGVIFLLLCAGGALAMPASFNAEPEEEVSTTLADLPEDLELEDATLAVEGETTDVTVPDEDEDENEDGSEDGDSQKPENHGKAVSTAAHCDLKGRAKGQLVSSVARDKSATAATAQAACDAAIAAQEAAPAKAKPAKPAHVAKPAKAPKAPKAPSATKAPKVEETEAAETEEVSTDSTETSGPPAHAGPPGDKGNGKKP